MSSRVDFFYYAFRNILLVSTFLLVISGVILYLPHSSAVNNSSADYVSINLPPSCTLSATGNNSHITSMVSGQLKEGIGLTEINTLCNDKDGYIVYAKGITQNSNNEVVLSSPIGPNYDIKTGNIPSTNGNSSWAVKLNKVAGDYAPTIESSYENKYTLIPNTWTKVVSKSSGTGTNPDISDNAKSAFTTTYAVYTTPSQPAGTYSGQVQYILLHPSTADKLAPDINTAFYNAGKSTVSVLDPETGEYGNFYKMQDIDSGICGSITGYDEPTTAKLVDIRDNKLYYVTKLKDGNCWMTQNLALDLETTPTNVAPLTSENTDLNDNSLSGAYELGYTYENNVLTWRPANETISFSGNTVNGWENSANTPYSANKTDSINYGHQSVRNYYNWSAAIASNSSNTLTQQYNNANNSICPKGWRLPIYSNITDKNDFTKLNNLYNSGSTTSNAGLITQPLWFAQSGYIAGNSLRDLNLIAQYWSNTTRDAALSYILYFTYNNVITNGSGYWGLYVRANGFSVRCLAR